MSIATTAPEKFDFQDIACVDMMLRFYDQAEGQFFVEPKGGEDGELVLGSAACFERFEIQVKGAEGQVTLAHVASCLAHFPPREYSGTLLERLLDDEKRMVVLVMSGRCDDAASMFAAEPDWAGAPHKEGQIKLDDAEQLLKQYAGVEPPGKGDGGLKPKRQAHCKEIAATVAPRALRAALRRLIILERLTENYLEERCGNYLRSAHRIPDDKIPDLLLRLCRVIRPRKKKSEADVEAVDVYPLLRQEIERASGLTIRPHDYVLRGPERDWAEVLSNECCLLLSGPPRVGKSRSARWVAAEYERHGYEIQKVHDVESAERFLLAPGGGHRLALLDDPLGANREVPDPEGTLSSLEALISQLRTNRKLIVAQRQDRLLGASQRATLAEVKSDGHSWVDLGNGPGEFLASVWRHQAQHYSVKEPLLSLVEGALQRGESELEAGCLRHLASEHSRLLEAGSLDHAVRLAREEASSFGTALRSEGFTDLLLALAVASGAGEPIAVSELAFVNGRGGNELPGKLKHDKAGIRLGGPQSPPVLPTYENAPQLAPDDEERLDQLELRGLIDVVTGGRVIFTHPFYRAAAEAVLGKPTSLKGKTLVAIIERGLFCPEPVPSRATARNLEWVYERLETNRDAQEALVALAIEGLLSCFPSTRDLCFRFLVRKMPSLPSSTRDLPGWVKSVSWASLSHIVWVEGEACLPLDGMTDWTFRGRVSAEDVATEVGLLDSPDGGYLSPQGAAHALAFYSQAPEKLSPQAIARLLSFDEGALRAEATKLWLQLPRADDRATLERIFNDEHPLVGMAALKGTVRGWTALSTSRQSQLVQGLKQLALSAPTAIAMLQRLVLFDRAEHTGENPPWTLFEEVMPIAVRALPGSDQSLDDRLYHVVGIAVSKLSAEALVAICDGWIDWLARITVQGALPSNAALGVLDRLIAATEQAPALREGRVERLLAFPGTGAPSAFVGDLVDYWAALTEPEQAKVEALLTAERTDRRWLQAVALARRHVPESLQRLLLGEETALDSGVDEILARWAPELLDAIVHVYSGEPGILHWIGVAHRAPERWQPLLESLATRPAHPLFDFAFEQLLFDGDGEQIASIVRELGSDSADRIFTMLLRKVACSRNHMPEAWKALFDVAKDQATTSGWIKEMANLSPLILEDLRDLNEWLEGESRRAMIVELKDDIAFLFVLRETTQWPDLEAHKREALVAMLEEYVKTRPPHLFGTCDRVLDFLTQWSIKSDVISRLVTARRAAIFVERDRLKRMMRSTEATLPGWIAP